MRSFVAVLVGKAVMGLLRRFGLGGGTQLPGRVALAIAPTLDRALSDSLPRGVILITGTNGKTTASRLLASILRADEITYVRNSSGANLRSGIASALIEAADLRGRVRRDVGVFEADEGAAVDAIRILAPRIVAVTNFFRDQLDRYGELDTTARRIGQSLRLHLPSDSTLVLNADDPRVCGLRQGVGANVRYLGIDGLEDGDHGPALASDSGDCDVCGRPFLYKTRYFAHLGEWECPGCGARRPPLATACLRAEPEAAGQRLRIAQDGEELPEVRLSLPGLYNAYNVMVAVAIAREMAIGAEAVRRGVETVSPAFGRAEWVDFEEDKRALLLLVKNPTGCNEVIRGVVRAGPPRHAVVALNDRTADGRDVSWIWDAELEGLVGAVASVIASGRRAEDMAVRLKYAGFDTHWVDVIKNPRAAIAEALRRAAPGEAVLVLATYTAMLGLRRRLQREGRVGKFWEE